MGLQGIYGLPGLACRSREVRIWVALVCKSHGVSILVMACLEVDLFVDGECVCGMSVVILVTERGDRVGL